MKKRNVLSFAGVMTLCVLLAACSSKDGKNETSATAVETTAMSEKAPETKAAEANAAVKETAASGEKEAAGAKTGAGSAGAGAADKSASKTAFQALPDDLVTIEFVSEQAYDPTLYADLAKKGSMSESELDDFMEFVGDLTVFDFAGFGISQDYFYGDCVSQSVIEESDGQTRVVEADTFSGDPLADAVMKKVGYSDYSISYFYPFSIWRQAGEKYNKPVCVSMTIDGKPYEYYFCDDELVRRVDQNGTQDNPETNDFMNSIYKLGCYYGNVLSGERNRYNLFVTSMDCIERKDDSFVITCGFQGREGTYSLVIDQDTKFSDDCETQFFDGYQYGDTPFDWYDRAMYEIENGTSYEQSGISESALLGILDVKASNGNHVDEICGTYWWD